MKTVIRIIASAALIALAASTAWTQDEKVDPGKLPPRVATTLEGKFPGATIAVATKTLENGEVVYDIEMTRGGRKHEMDVKEDGTIVNFENEIAPGDLPQAVSAAVRARYPRCRIKEAMEVMVIRDKKDVLEEYEVLIETADHTEVELTVSPDGKKIE